MAKKIPSRRTSAGAKPSTARGAAWTRKGGVTVSGEIRLDGDLAVAHPQPRSATRTRPLDHV